MRLYDLLYVLGLIFVLLFAANCSCQKDPVDPQHYWVICQDSPGGTHQPVLTNGKETRLSGQLFDPTQWSCPDTSNSPIWVGSGKPVYSTNGPKTNSVRGRAGRAALGPGLAAYLPALLLDLPFPALRAGTEATDLNCDPSQPDVLQVNHDRSTVNRISTCPFRAVATIPVASRPLQIAITPDGTTALVTSFDNVVNFINLGSNQVTFSLRTGNINPDGIVITPDGAFAYITNFVPGSDASIAKIDLTSRSIVQMLPARSGYPQNVFLSPDGEQLYVTYPFGNLVQIIDTLTNSETTALSVPSPRGIGFNSKGTKAYIASASSTDGASGTVEVLNTNTFQVETMYKVGLGPNDVAVLYGDQFVVTSNYEGKSISKIDTVGGNVQTTPLNGQISGLSIVR